MMLAELWSIWTGLRRGDPLLAPDFGNALPPQQHGYQEYRRAGLSSIIHHRRLISQTLSCAGQTPLRPPGTSRVSARFS